MEFRQLRAFAEVVRQGTVTDAAIALGRAPSSVSEQIRALEEDLGVALFDRTGRGMRLTPAGERLLVWADRLTEQVSLARREVAGGPLRLGALETVAGTLVPDVLARLAARAPGVSVEVRPEPVRDRLLADVASGALDAALFLSSGDGTGAELASVDVRQVPLRLVAAPGHPLAGRDLTAADLAGERLLVNVPGCSFRRMADRALGPAPQRVLAGGVAVTRAWVERGMGVAVLPDFALAGASVVTLGLPIPDLTLRLAWRPDREDAPGLRALLYAAASS